MIIKHPQVEVRRIAVTEADLREQLVELWAAVFEAELRADLEEASRSPRLEGTPNELRTEASR
jgi:hypothetical protein